MTFTDTVLTGLMLLKGEEGIHYVILREAWMGGRDLAG